MSPVATVAIHHSQFPDAIRRDLIESLRTGLLNHKFHYDSVKQTQKWLALHRALSPSRNDPDCASTYDRAFAGALDHVSALGVHLVGLGCGGGQKDARLLSLLHKRGKQLSYAPCDVSTAMVLVARQAALDVIAEENCFPLVCDLATSDDLPDVLASQGPQDAVRLYTFFGMIPNFETAQIFSRLSSLLRPGDLLLTSANLAPGEDYLTGVQRILPQYDNTLTRNWLMTMPWNLGIAQDDGNLRFHIEDDPVGDGLKRIVARFHFTRLCEIAVEDEKIVFNAGRNIRIFFSGRQTAARMRATLAGMGTEVLGEWITRSGEESIHLCRR